jgi:hypothetical protein
MLEELNDDITSLKKELTRKPGMEITDKLKIKENEVREKARQMKAMAGELNMNQAQVSFSNSFYQGCALRMYSSSLFCNVSSR